MDDELAGFVDVERRSRVPSPDPEVSLQRAGSMGLNPAAVKALGSPPGVHLKYRVDPPALAIIAATRDDRNAYALQANSGSAVVNSKQAIGLLGLDTSQLRRYRAKVIDGPALLIDLTAPLEE